MKAQALNPDLTIEVYEIATRMAKEKLSPTFIKAAVQTAIDFEGVYDLVKIWDRETDPNERDEIVADIQDLIDDCRQKDKQEAPYVKFNDLESIAKDIRAFKDSLLEMVIEKGGIKKLADLTEIPQPSLSRFFNTNAMPRRATLLRIARALKLDAIKIATEWSR